MKLINTLAIGLLAFAGMTSCEMKDEIKGDKATSEVGYLDLGVFVDTQKNQQTKADAESAEDFPVTIQDKNNAENKIEFQTYRDLLDKNPIELAVGSYIVTAHTPGELTSPMNIPYYKGEKDLTITKGKTEEAEVKCTMQNMKITINLDAAFLSVMQTWRITVTDGNNHTVSLSETSSVPYTQYITVAENVSILKVTLTGTKKDGTEYKQDTRSITKKEGGYWGAADALTLNMGVSTDLTIPGIDNITIKIDAFFENTESIDEPIDVIPDDSGDSGDSGNTGDTEKAAPTITFPQDIDTYTLPQDQDKDATAGITAKAGLKSVIVQITAGNSDFSNIINGLKDEGVNFIDGVELVGNEEFFKDVISEFAGYDVAAPKMNETSYSFPVKAFFEILSGMGATDTDAAHIFKITVTDNQDRKVEKSLNVIVKE